MRHEIVLAPEAIQDLKRLKAHRRVEVKSAIEEHLRFQPMKTSKSRIKRLHGLLRPQFRLRVDDLRVYYDVTEESVNILAIVLKSQSEDWLRRAGEDA